MKIGIKPQKLGRTLFLGLALLSSCRKSQPPKIEICILDGFGGGDCIEADGSRLYRTPSQMKNYWATNQADEANFASWCYETSVKNIELGMKPIEKTVTLMRGE